MDMGGVMIDEGGGGIVVSLGACTWSIPIIRATGLGGA